MIDFVAYFSTAQDQLGYVLLSGHGTAQTGLLGGPAVPHGTYRVESGRLVFVPATPNEVSARDEYANPV